MISKQKTITGAVLLAFGAAMLQAAYLPRDMLFAEEGGMDIMTYPKVLMYALLGMTVLYLLRPAPDEEDSDWRGLLSCWPVLAGAVLSFALYGLAFEYLGLGLGTFVFMLMFFWVMRYRDPRRAIPIALAGAAIAWLVFEKALGVSMPRPLWLDWV